jgi:hypothetical protein
MRRPASLPRNASVSAVQVRISSVAESSRFRAAPALRANSVQRLFASAVSWGEGRGGNVGGVSDRDRKGSIGCAGDSVRFTGVVARARLRRLGSSLKDTAQRLLLSRWLSFSEMANHRWRPDASIRNGSQLVLQESRCPSRGSWSPSFSLARGRRISLKLSVGLGRHGGAYCASSEE